MTTRPTLRNRPAAALEAAPAPIVVALTSFAFESAERAIPIVVRQGDRLRADHEAPRRYPDHFAADGLATGEYDQLRQELTARKADRNAAWHERLRARLGAG